MKFSAASPVTGILAAFFTLLFAVSSPAQIKPPTLPLASVVPLMTIKIFNDDPDKNYIFPVLTTGKRLPNDIWLQAFFKVPRTREGIDTYKSNRNYRLYINELTGIKPNDYVLLTVPLYTQLVATVVPSNPEQYIDWWNGATIQLYNSPTATAPRALSENLINTNKKKRPFQNLVTPIANAVKPVCQICTQGVANSCRACTPLRIFSDDGDLPKGDPAQLLEFTLGARVEQPATSPVKNTLDLRNVDFDVSYVNVAYLPSAMGPVGNDQVGYVGTPQGTNSFQNAIKKFLADPRFADWPRFVTIFADNSKQTINKLPSPLELFARIAPGAAFPTDLEPIKPPGKWPTSLWKPVQALRNNWFTWAGKVGPNGEDFPGQCKISATKKTFCDAIVEAKKLLLANYKNYKAVFASKCKGKPIVLTDDIMVAHVYGWTPFVEAIKDSGDGCPADANKLQDSTPAYKANHFAEYARVKLLFDLLNYGKDLTDPKYTFNPWVTFIHGAAFANTPNAYAYSVDDAVGNIQAEAVGFIVDYGSTKNLENKLPAGPPITVFYSIGDPLPIKMTRYRICKDDPSRERAVQQHNQAFVINANNPSACPVYFFDNKSPPQKYTFKIIKKPPYKQFQDPAQSGWTLETSAPIDCSGNHGLSYQPTSRTWCCVRLPLNKGNGVFAYQTPVVDSAHKALDYRVVLHAPEQQKFTTDQACNDTTLPQALPPGDVAP